MREINLTGTLKTYKAIVVSSNQDIPEGYIEIAGGLVGGEDFSIAIPEKLGDQTDLLNNLARQAQKCILRTNEDDLTEGEF